jgi:CO dehydrogenase/acetyl-CoA synthase beta subunit
MAKLKRIHVNQHNIRANRKNDNQDLPVFSVKTYDQNITANCVVIDGPSVMMYSPDKPLSCGAHVWCETKAKVTVELGGNVLEIE